jgi:hypothetical protein
MQSVSCTQRGPLEAEQAKHTAAGGRHSILEHHRGLELFGDYSSRSCIYCWLCESFSGGATRGSPCSSEEDSPLCGGTCNWGLWFGRKKGNQTLLTGFSDTDFARDVDARKSTTEVIFFLANSPIIWQSMKQKVVA